MREGRGGARDSVQTGLTRRLRKAQLRDISAVLVCSLGTRFVKSEEIRFVAQKTSGDCVMTLRDGAVYKQCTRLGRDKGMVPLVEATFTVRNVEKNVSRNLYTPGGCGEVSEGGQ